MFKSQCFPLPLVLGILGNLHHPVEIKKSIHIMIIVTWNESITVYVLIFVIVEWFMEMTCMTIVQFFKSLLLSFIQISVLKYSWILEAKSILNVNLN